MGDVAPVRRDLERLRGIVLDVSDVEERIRIDQAELHKIQTASMVEIKQNNDMSEDIKQLEKRIRLLVKQQIDVRQVLAETRHMTQVGNKEHSGLAANVRDLYAHMVCILQQEPHILSRLSRAVSNVDRPKYIEAVIHSIYGDQYHAKLERLLLIMFRQMLEAEVGECHKMGTFLRANTAITQMLTAYTKRHQSMTSLKEVLHEPLSRLATSDMDFEINPRKVYMTILKSREIEGIKTDMAREGVTEEEAILYPGVSEMIDKRQRELEAMLDDLLNRITDHVTRFPYGLRWISRQLRDVCYEKWPEEPREKVDALVGGFCFLRYITPAITTPDAMNIIDSQVSYRRNFVLLGKCIQNLSNNTRPAADKGEKYMCRMNPWLDNQKAKLQKFFDDLCDVEDLDEHMRMEVLVTMGEPSEERITLFLSDLYHVHKCIQSHLGHLQEGRQGWAEGKGEILDTLTKIVEDLGDAPAKPKRDDDYSISLATNEVHVSTYSLENDVAGEGNEAYPELRELFTQMLRMSGDLSHVNLSSGFNVAINTIKDEAAARQDFEMAELMKQIKNLTVELTTNKPDLYSSPEAVLMILTRDVTKTVDHHKKLSSNLESAKRLLEDVRKRGAEMKETKAMHMEYFKNVESNGQWNGGNIVTDKKKKLPTKEFSHKDLDAKGVILESRLPLPVRKSVKFAFSTADCSTFKVAAKLKGIEILSVEVKMEELLDMRENDALVLEVEDMKLNVNILIHLLNVNFLAKAEKRKDKHGKKKGNDNG